MGRKIAIGAGVVIVLLAIVATVILGQLGRLIERGVETAGPKITGTDVSLGSANVSVFSGEGALKKLHIGNPEGFTSDQAFDLGEIAIAVDTESVTSNVIHVRSVVIDGARLVAEFDAAGRNNLNTILSNVKAAARTARSGTPPPEAESDGTRTRMIIDEFRFENAQVQALAPLFGLDRALKLPPVVLKGLGARQGGLAAADMANQVMRPIVESAVRAAMREYVASQRDKLGDKAKEKLLDKVFGQ